jgi:hypothetical protein
LHIEHASDVIDGHIERAGGHQLRMDGGSQ